MVPAPTGWNTWDVRYHTGWAHLPGGLRVRFGLRDRRHHVRRFHLAARPVRLGHHTVDGQYAAAEVAAHDTTLALECAGGGDELAMLAELVATTGRPLTRLLIVDAAFGAPPVTIVDEASGRGRPGARRVPMALARLALHRPRWRAIG